MAPDKFEDLHLSDLSLEPLPDPGLLNYEAGAKKKEVLAPVNQVETRNKKVTDRRLNDADRRTVLRFEADRRSGKDRRPNKSWGPGKVT